MKRNLTLMAIAAMAFTTLLSCNDNESTNLDQVGVTNIVTFGGAISRVTGNAFDNGDEISVVAFDSDGELFGQATTYTYSDSGFASSSPIILPEGSSLSYFASYISQEGIEESFSFEIPTDQNSSDGYEKGDLLVAKIADSSSTNPTLQFSHTMSNLEVTISIVKDGEPLSGVTVSKISFMALNNASCNIASSSYLGTGSSAEITPAQVTANTKYSMILSPQTIAASTVFASITIGETTYTWSPSSDIEFESGLKYEYTWTIDQTLKTSEMSFSGDITSWGSGNIIQGDSTVSGDDNDSVSSTSEVTTTLTIDDFKSSSSEYTFTSDGIAFCTNFSTYGGYIYVGSTCYLYNTTAISGLKEVVINYNTFEGSNPASFYLNTSSTASSNANTGDYSRNLSGTATYIYTIGSGNYFYIDISTSTASIKSIEFTYESQN